MVKGVGNRCDPPGNGVDGAVQGSVIATYMHGPCLARNPQLADLLLSTVMHPAAMLLFPTWVVIAGLVVFIRAGRVAEPAESERQSK